MTPQEAGGAQADGARAASVQDFLAVGYLTADEDWAITSANAEARRILGLTGDDMTGRVLWELFPTTFTTTEAAGSSRGDVHERTVTFEPYYSPALSAWFELLTAQHDSGIALYFLDITARRAADNALEAAVLQQATDAQTMTGLVAAARALGEADTEPQVLAVVSEYTTALLGIKGCALSLLEADGGGVRSLSSSYSDQVLATFDLLPMNHPLPAVRTAVTGAPNYLSDLAAISAQFPGCEHIYAAGGIESSAAVPLQTRGRLLGSLSVGFATSHPWRPAERGLLEAFAALTAQALDRAAARNAERAATERARHAMTQQATLVAIAQALDHAHTEDGVLRVIIDHGVGLLGAQGAVLSIVEHPDRSPRPVVRALATDFFDEEVRAAIAVLPADFPLPMIDTAVTGTPHFFADRAASSAAFSGSADLCAAAGTEASAAVPLRVSNTVFASLSVAFDHPHTWTANERTLLEAFAALTGQALQRITSHDAERAASAEVARFSETLQRSLLTSPPEPDHLQIAVRYSPALAVAQVGGDWYDAFMTRAGSISIVIGDVTGHDRHAAAAMGQLRNLLRGIGYGTGEPPAAVLSTFDRAIRDLEVSALATIVLAQIEQPAEHAAAGTRVLRWSNAGHPPPLLLEPGAAPRYLKTRADLLIGIDPHAERHDHTVALNPGATVLLYTDGLIERRGAHLQKGFDWLAGAAADLAHLTLDELCDALLTHVGDRIDDDVALLAVRAHPEDAPRPREAGPGRDPLHSPA